MSTEELTPTELFTATVEATPTATPTATVEPELVIDESAVQIILNSGLEYVSPGTDFNLSWEIQGLPDLKDKKTDLVMAILVPDSLQSNNTDLLYQANTEKMMAESESESTSESSQQAFLSSEVENQMLLIPLSATATVTENSEETISQDEDATEPTAEMTPTATAVIGQEDPTKEASVQENTDLVQVPDSLQTDVLKVEESVVSEKINVKTATPVPDGEKRKATPTDQIVVIETVEPEIEPTQTTTTEPEDDSNSLKGTLSFSIPKDNYDNFTFTAAIFNADQSISYQVITIPNRQVFQLDKTGGEIKAYGGLLEISMPQKAMTENMELLIGDAVKRTDTESGNRIGRSFEITAKGMETKSNLSKFDDEITLVYHLDQEKLPVAIEDLNISWLDEGTGLWIPLDTGPDPETMTISATTNHFTIFTVNVNNYEFESLPSIDGFQISNFTGSGTFDYPLSLPEGPGGFTPSLNLTYNSQIIDQATTYSQPTWVGMGWDLDLPYIERDMAGTQNVGNDLFYFKNNGVGGILLMDSNGVYHTTDETFTKITVANDQWNMLDKNGTEYIYTPTLSYNYLYACGSSGVSGGHKRTGFSVCWSLTAIKNTLGNQISIAYDSNTDQFKWKNCTGKNSKHDDAHASYPSKITYANGRYQIQFVRTADRYDYNSSIPHIKHDYLSQVNVYEDGNGDGIFENLVKKYALTYETDMSKQMMPGFDWGAAGITDWRDHTLTLKSIQEFGANGSSSLPAYEFTYADKLHLTKVVNGYGGEVTFDYNQWYFNNGDDTQNSTIDGLVRASQWQGSASGPGWGPAASGDYAYEYYNTLRVMGTGLSTGFMTIYKPGGVYRIVASGSRTNGSRTPTPLGDNFRVGFSDGTANSYSEPASIVSGTGKAVYFYTLPGSANGIIPLINSSSVLIFGVKVELLPPSTGWPVKPSRMATDITTCIPTIMRARP